MSERIEPALTPAQWARWNPTSVNIGDLSDRHAPRVTFSNGSVGVVDDWGEAAIVPIPALIALANAALPDSDPRKITREKIALLRIEHISECDGDVCEYPTRELAAFADALESLLPPEK